MVHHVYSSQCTFIVKDYHSTCVDAVGVLSADGVEIVADDGEPRIICMLEFSMFCILPSNSLLYFNWLSDAK